MKKKIQGEQNPIFPPKIDLFLRKICQSGGGAAAPLYATLGTPLAPGKHFIWE